jgi:hypothetical protein
MQANSVSLFDFTFSSADLVFAAAILLALAGLLLVFSSRRKIAIEQSLVTEEMLILLARIAEALEIQAGRTPEKLIADLTTALRQASNVAPLQMPPQPPPPTQVPQQPPPRENPTIVPMRFPLYNGEVPPER